MESAIESPIDIYSSLASMRQHANEPIFYSATVETLYDVENVYRQLVWTTGSMPWYLAPLSDNSTIEALRSAHNL